MHYHNYEKPGQRPSLVSRASASGGTHDRVEFLDALYVNYLAPSGQNFFLCVSINNFLLIFQNKKAVDTLSQYAENNNRTATRS